MSFVVNFGEPRSTSVDGGGKGMNLLLGKGLLGANGEDVDLRCKFCF